MNQPVPSAPWAQPAKQSTQSQLNKQRRWWVVLAIVFGLAAYWCASSNVTVSANSLDYRRSSTLDCGSVVSPQSEATSGLGFSNQDSLCNSARHGREVGVFILGALALVNVVLAGMAFVAESQKVEEN